MSYTINPNAKNKWARNAENTMDLSLETDASSVYLDNGRTLEQEVGEGSMVSNVTTVDTSMSKVIDGTLDGAYESGVMYGRTLINVLDKKKLLVGPNTTLENDGSITAIANGGYYNIYFSDNGVIKENSEYLLIYEIIENTLDVDFYVNGGYSTNGLYENIISGGKAVPPLTTGYFVERVRTRLKSECIDNFKVLRTFIDTGATVGTKIKYRVQLIEYQEGLENVEIPFFEGLCDVKMPILRNVGKNLFDGEWEAGQYDATGNKVDTYLDVDIRSKNYIPVAPNKTYVFGNNGASRATHVREYNLKHQMVGRHHAIDKFTSTKNTHYITVYGAKENRDKFQIEESSTFTAHEDHKTNILHTPETVTLRSLPNGVRDELNVMTGEYIKRIGEVVLDGSQNLGLNNDLTNCTRISVTGATIEVSKPTYAEKTISDKLICIRNWATDTEHYYIKEDGSYPILFINKTKLLTLNVEGAKQYLQSNPITIQYELAEPVTTIVEPLTIPFAYQNGHVILESGFEGQSLLPTLEYSTVVNKTGLIENVVKTIQAQEKQLTMLEKMLIQNIINLDYNNTLLTLKNEMEEML